MLGKMFNTANKLFSKFVDFQPVVVYPSSSGHCCISCRTMDDKVFAYAESVQDGYKEKEFAIRNWGIINSLLGVFSNDLDNLSVQLKYNSNDYPHLAIFSTKDMKINHYLQSYNMISNQSDLLNAYNKRKLNLKTYDGEGDTFFTDEVVKNIGRLSSLLDAITFKIVSNNDGIFVVFGQENQTIDNGVIKLSDPIENFQIKDNIQFSVVYFLNIYKALCSEDNFRMKVLNDKIIFCSQNDVATKVCILVGYVQ